MRQSFNFDYTIEIFGSEASSETSPGGAPEASQDCPEAAAGPEEDPKLLRLRLPLHLQHEIQVPLVPERLLEKMEPLRPKQAEHAGESRVRCSFR